MKKIFTCLFITTLCFGKTTTVPAQVNVQDSLALVDLYNSTNGSSWKYHSGWLTTARLKDWYGVTVINRRVVRISLENNKLNGHIPSSLGNLSNLAYLFLDYNQLSGSIPSSLGNLSLLIYLYLHDNQLSGSIPSSLGKLPNLYVLSLGYNQLSGDIPSSLGNLSNLAGLYLNNNQLSGTIPSSLGKDSNLLYLNLRYNQLSDNIPSSLGDLSNLQNGFINYNKFTFAGMEGMVQTQPNIKYSPQASIPVIQKNDSVLLVNAGGILTNNRYKWFKNGVLIKSKIGGQTLATTGAGKYNVVVTNSICTKLTLYSDTITITGFSADKNVINKTNSKTSVYPNPANNFIHLTLDKPASSNTTIVLYNMQGKAMMQQKVAAGSLTQQYSLSNLAAGNYLLVIMENGKKIHEERFVIVR